ncbi:MAG: pilus assembly protein PilM [Syntrophobacterales bacterium]|nr:pilus assembly protein PilM [Syntrophobacterales bacterium]
MLDINSLFSGGNLLAGLDIGSSCIKLAELTETSKEKVLSRFTMMPLANGVIVEGAVAEAGALAAVIKELYKKSGCKRKKVVLSISGNSVIVKKVSFAQMEESELGALIHDEADKYLPFDDMSLVDYDFQITGENPYNSSQMDVLIVAAKKELVEGYTDAVAAAGLTPVIMDVDSFAVETMYGENYDFEENDLAVLVNIGASITNLNVVKGGMSIFTRDFNMGGNSITEALAASLGISLEEAEKAKIEGRGDDPPSRELFRAGLISYADAICSEIERSIDYFHSTFGQENIGRVLLSGGGALTPGIAGEMERRLGIETALVDPFKKIKLDKKVLEAGPAELLGPLAAVSIGLALRKIGDK